MQRDPAVGGNVPAHAGAELVEMAPGLHAVGPVRIEDWARVPAGHLGPDRLWALRERVREILTGPDAPDGIVITHGTDILEETAYLLARTLEPGTPVVVTGAMRTSSDSGWDGPGNLVNAARVAAAPESRGRGTMVVFAGKIFAGHEAVKVHTQDPDAFAAPHAAPLGVVSGSGVLYRRAGTAATCIAPPGLTARVALIPAVVGDDGTLLDLARPHHDGCVLVAFGSGNAPPGLVPAVRRWLSAGKPVVLASRCPFGEVAPLYAFEGGGARLIELGALPAGPRTPSQARMELTIALSAGVTFGQGGAPVPA